VIASFTARLRAYLQVRTPAQPWTLDRDGIRRLALAAGACAFAALALFLTGGYHAAFLAVNGFGPGFPEVLLQTLTYCGDSLSILVGLLLFAGARRDVTWVGFIVALVGTALSHLPKDLVNAARPPAVIDAADRFLSGPALMTHSFPSGHTVSAFIGAGMFLYFARRWTWRWLPLLPAAAVGASRVLVGVHWPVDVLAGGAIGLISVAIGAALAVRLQRAASFAMQLTLVALLAGCAVALLLRRPDYPLAYPGAVALGLAGLAAFAWHYLYAPRSAA
jgi:membrane-associated phospholipid phosphatase